MTPASHRRSHTPAADLVVVASLVAVVCVPVWPGILTVDSLEIFASVREGRISNWYGPLHTWAWGLVDRVGPLSLVFLLGVTGFVAALLFLTRQFLTPPAARLVTAITVLFPPVYGLLGWVGRDVWFASAALAITGAVWRARDGATAKLWTPVALVILGAAAADARQNGAPFAFLAVSAAALLLLRRVRPEAATATRGAVVVLSLLLFWVGLLSAQRAVVRQRMYPEQILFAGDLMAVSLARDEPVIDAGLFPTQDLEKVRVALAGREPPYVIYAVPALVRYERTSAEVNKAWARQWRAMLREHPWRYLEWRTTLYLSQIGITGEAQTPYFEESDSHGTFAKHEVTSAFPRLLAARNRLLAWAVDVLDWGPPLRAPLLYIAASLVAIGMIGRHSGKRRLAALLVAVLVAMQALIFFGALSTEFRLEYYQLIFGVALGSVALTLHLPALRRARRNHRVGFGQGMDLQRQKVVVERAMDGSERDADHAQNALHPGDD